MIFTFAIAFQYLRPILGSQGQPAKDLHFVLVMSHGDGALHNPFGLMSYKTCIFKR